MKPCSIYKLWPLFLVALVITGCRSSRFMQDDMYFTSIDAKREVREYEVAKAEVIRKQYLMQNPDKPKQADSSFFDMSTYYDYSYASRIRRFQHDNTWAYYDPYYTNYYWFNPSNSSYFGNSVYSSYAWWGPNLGNNYSSDYWNINSRKNLTKKWLNPWQNPVAANSWRNPYFPFYYNGWNSPMAKPRLWNYDFTYANLYYNSLDNNCYWGWWKRGKIPGGIQNNFAALNQRNGISTDVVKRPEINYTQIREDYNRKLMDDIEAQKSRADSAQVAVSSNTTENNPRTVKADTKTTNSNTSNTSKRWNNYKADVKITDKKNDADSKWSRSGVFSEGSRDNNYQFNGSINKKKEEKDPNR